MDSSFQIRSRQGGLSLFPQNIGRLIVDFYCPEDGIVYDPFAGHNSRMELVFRCNRNYVGVDISQKFMDANGKVRDRLYKERNSGLNIMGGTSDITLIKGSSSKVDLPSSYADFTITSPPYWDIEYYGEEPEQLGKARTYEKFLELLSGHVVENYRILKSGAFCCWFINDFRKNKKFCPYHIDLYKIFCDVGFIPFTIYIVDLGNSINQAFVQDIIKTKLFPKCHEYILVFTKP